MTLTSLLRKPFGALGWLGENTTAEPAPFRIETVADSVSITLSDIDIEPNVFALVEDMRSDYQVAQCIKLLKAAVSSATVSIRTRDDADERTKDLAVQLVQLWRDHIGQMFEAVEYGRAAFRRKWQNSTDSGLTEVELEYLPAYYDETGARFTSLRMSSAGGYDGVVLHHQSGGDSGYFGPGNSWWLTYDATLIRPYGRSIYRGAPATVRESRRKLFQLRSIFLERFVFRGGVVYAEPTVKDSVTGTIYNNFALMAQKLMEHIRGGWLILTSRRDGNGHLRNEVHSDASIMDPKPLDEVIRGTDSEMSRSMGIHPQLLMGTPGGGGTQNSVSEFAGLMISVAEDILSQLAASFQKYVIAESERRNFTPDALPGLKLTVAPLSRDETSTLAKLVSAWATNSTLPPVVEAGVIDVMEAMKSEGVPVVDGASKLFEEYLKKRVAEQERQRQQMQDQIGGNSAGASGFRQAGPRPNEQGGDGGNPRDPASQAGTDKEAR